MAILNLDFRVRNFLGSIQQSMKLFSSLPYGFSKIIMPPSHPTLAKTKVGSNNPAFSPSTLSSSEPSWQMMWHGLKVEVLSLKHRPSHRYLNMRQEYRTFKSVISRPCDWLLSSLTYEGTRSSVNN
jgi:hypothetical protein